METYYRIGAFFILVGLALLLLFFLSIFAGYFHGTYLLLSIISLVVGFMLRRDKPVKESGRFSTFKRFSDYNRRRRQDEYTRRRNRRMSRGRPGQRSASGEDEDDKCGDDSSNE